MARNSKTTIAIAVAGSADIRPLTIQSALNDYLGFGDPDDSGVFEASDKYEVTLFFPAGPQHWNDSLEKVWKWSAQADIPYTVVVDKNGKDDDLEYVVNDADDVIEVANVSKALIDTLVKADADEKVFIALWGEEGDDEAEAILTFAEAADIPAKDLTAGLDDLRFGDEDEAVPVQDPEPEPEEEKPRRGRRRQQEEPEEEKPRRRGRGSKPEPVEEEQSLDEAEEALDDEPAKAEPAKEEKVALAKEVKAEPVAETPAKEKSWGEAGAGHVAKQDIPDVVWTALATARKYFRMVDETNAVTNLADEVKPSPITLLIGEAFKALENLGGGEETVKTSEAVSVAQGPDAVAEEPRRRGRPRKSTEETFAYLKNDEEGTYRKAGRGRPRRGETRVELTQSEVDDLIKQDLVEDVDN